MSTGARRLSAALIAAITVLVLLLAVPSREAIPAYIMIALTGTLLVVLVLTVGRKRPS